MLKLVIADDEKIIRETISTIIDWKQYGIEIVKLCKNGLEAYNTILDESPDIVLTDIKMPGMDGLQLIKNVSDMGLDVQFIILSGYGEFEYAKTAMEYGVKHYLLKPCNEKQILNCIQKTAQDCYQKKLSLKIGSSQFMISSNMQHSTISSLLNDSISTAEDDLDHMIHNYEAFMDFYYTPYTLFYVYFLEYDSLPEFLEQLKQYCQTKIPRCIVHGIYVTNTLLLFFKDYSETYEDFIQFLTNCTLTRQTVDLNIEVCRFPSLKDLLTIVLKKVQRFSMIYYLNNFHIFASCNYDFFTARFEQYYQAFRQNRNKQELQHITDLMTGIDNLNFYRQITISLILKLSSDNLLLSAAELTEWIARINREDDLEQLKVLISHELRQIFSSEEIPKRLSPMTRQIIDYVTEHLSDQNLTLKYIAENHLYMNVDYVSRKFYKDTGEKFSQYLAECRIRKAQEYLSSNEADKIQDVAELVGYGNNPQYFSQQFKKLVGMTPSAYTRKFP